MKQFINRVRWFFFIARLEPKLRKHVKAFLQELQLRFSFKVPVPRAQVIDDNDVGPSLYMVWEPLNGEHHLDVEVFLDGTYEWFYRNRKTDDVEGTDKRVPILPLHLGFVTHLYTVLFADKRTQ